MKIAGNSRNIKKILFPSNLSIGIVFKIAIFATERIGGL